MSSPLQDRSDAGAACADREAKDGSLGRQRALERLVASRQRLHSTWLPADEPASAASGARRNGRLAVMWRRWRRSLNDQPLVALALDAAEHWWQHNPWHLAGQAVATELGIVLKPRLRRHPVLAVALAAGTGLAIVYTRPWAWPGVAAHLRPLPRMARGWLLAQLTHVPLQSMLSALATAGKWPTPTSTPTGEAADAPGASAQPAQSGATSSDVHPRPVGVV